MGLHVAEVAPLAAPAIEALPLLLALAGLMVALGMIRFVVSIVDALLWVIHKTIGRIPGAGGAVEGLAKRSAQKITNALGKAEQGLDNYIGWCFHNLAHVARMFLREIEGLAHDLWMVTAVLPGLVTQAVFRHLVRGIRSEIKAWLHLLRRVGRIAHVRTVIVERTVIHNVIPRVRAGEAAIEHVIEWDIPRLRARERAITRRLERLWKWSRSHARIAATGAFVAATAVALRRMGLGWLRCRNVKRFGRTVCGMNAPAFDALLAGLIGGLALADYRDLVRKMQDVEHAVAEELIDLLHAFD